MLKLPSEIHQQFTGFLVSKKLSDKDKFFSLKYLRFYWDFYHKYQHPILQPNSQSLFENKLRQKGQSDAQINQAQQAVSFFYEMRHL